VACEFGAKGDRVGLLARGETGLDGAVKDVERAGGRALAVPTEVADHRQVEAAAEQIERTLGPIDIWVNVAFTSVFAPFTQIDPDEFRRVTEVTYLGYVYGTRAALDRMLARDHGTIVQVGSTLAYRGIPLQTAYCGAKHAIQGFHEALRCELLHQGSRVRVTMVQLPAVNTPQFDWVLNRLPNHPQPVPPIYQPEVVARAILHAAEHPRRREYWVGGSTVGTLLGDKFAPGLLDRYLARTGYKAQQSEQPADPNAPRQPVEPRRRVGRPRLRRPRRLRCESGRPQPPGLAFATPWPAGGLRWGPRGPGRAAALAPMRCQSAVGRAPDDGAGVHAMDCGAGPLPEICQKLRYTQPRATPHPDPRQRLSPGWLCSRRR
jgi:NAD(P)-dependent dehydrogenase (short-subunit alcohol dehydrogenase family)